MEMLLKFTSYRLFHATQLRAYIVLTDLSVQILPFFKILLRCYFTPKTKNDSYAISSNYLAGLKSTIFLKVQEDSFANGSTWYSSWRIYLRGETGACTHTCMSTLD